MLEVSIGSTHLRQQLTDVLSAVRERGVVYVVETFGRPQAALINFDEYAEFQRYQRERKAFFDWADDTAAANAAGNAGLSDNEVLAIIEQARQQAVG